MSVDPELLADFLIETEELIADLGGQIMDMEQTPDDSALLNAVFRSFHTVKGGAGFLELKAMVDLCHTAEDLCNGLRGGKFALTPEMVDALSQSVDHLQAQHEALKNGEEPAAAEPELLDRLHALGHPEDAAGGDANSEEDELEALLDAAHGVPAQSETAAAPPSMEDEMDALLDQMHGVSPSPAEPAPAEATPSASASAKPPPQPAAPKPAAKPAGDKPVVEASIRVDTSRLDAVMNLVGELVLVRNHLKMLVRQGVDQEVSRVSGRLDRVTGELQSGVMKMRMQAIRKVFARFPKIVRDLARSLGKDIELELVGEETELDKNLVEALADPLIHLVRNSVDHGVETPEKRAAAGKPAKGHIRLAARQEGDDIVITITDDGGGIDPNVLRSRAIERGVLDQDEAARMDGKDCLQIIFMPGFSTRAEVSDVSGRGVGMDVVKTRIDQLNGQINIDSTVGEGTVMELRVPLTLAILATLMVRAGKRVFAVPLSNVDDVMMFDRSHLTRLDGRQVYMLHGEPIHVLGLGQWCGEREGLPDQSHMILLRHGGERFGLVVDTVVGREEVVIKPLGPPLEQLLGFSGATVTGDGRVALILDPIGILKILHERSTILD